MPGEWYESLRKPAWNPPHWIFGPVWSALYAMMAVAAWSVWRPKGFTAAKLPLTLFLLQLALNATWTPLFFGLRRPGSAMICIALLWLAILTTLIEFRKVSPMATALMIPYLAWVTFASALNFELWRLNASTTATWFVV